MIVANLATYPPRRAFLPQVLAAISPQVDRVNLVLNQYEAVPGEVEAFANVHAILPDEDCKDAGKFHPDVTDAAHVLLIDDDIIYPEDFVALTLERFAALPLDRAVAGYHCSIYRKPSLAIAPRALRRALRMWLAPRTIADYREILYFRDAVAAPCLVDQVATNACILRGRDLPPYDYMRSSQKFVDVRLAKWCFDRGIPRVCLPRAAGWLRPSDEAGVTFEESIFAGFTRKHHAHVADEIRSFAFRTPGVGQAP